MKNKKTILPIILIILIIIFNLGLLIYKFYKGYEEDKNKTEEKISQINQNYNSFINNLENFNIERENIYNEIFQENYLEDMQINIVKWNSIIQNYSNTIREIDDNSKYLKDNCKNIQIINAEINKNCDSFNNNYETMINSYITDINLYNQNIEAYNNWLNENEENIQNLSPIDKYIDKNYTKYIDYNNDGEFLGKD